MLITSIHHNEIPAEKFATFQAACASTETLNKTIVVSSDVAIDSDVTVEDRALRIANGGKLTVASTKTLTINAPFQAGLYQVFDGDGSVVFGSGSVSEVYPEWWYDGLGDWTAAIQAAFDCGSGSVCIKGGTYTVNPLTINSNTKLTLSPDTVLQAKTGYIWSDCLLNIIDKANITIFGNGATVQLLRDEYPLQEIINGSLINSEYRHCVRVYGSSEIRFYDLTCIDAGGDGFSIGGPTTCYNIYLHNCVGDNNRRQGVSVTNAVGCWIVGGEYRNTNGLAPQRGIDIEPNPEAGYVVQNIHCIGVTTKNNSGGGILVSPGLPTGVNEPVSIFVTDCTSIGDALINGSGGFSAIPGTGITQNVGGVVIFENCVAIDPGANGFVINRWNDYCPRLIIRGLQVANPGSTVAGNVNKNGILFRTEPGDPAVGNGYGNFEIQDPFVFDETNPGGTSNTYYPVYINNANFAVQGISDVIIRNLKTKRLASVWGGGGQYNTLVSTTSILNYRVVYDEPFIYPAGTETLPKHAIGATHVATASRTITLPAASDHIGATYLFRNDSDGALFVINPQSFDFIEGYSPFTGGGIIARKRGAHIALTATSNNSWRASQVSGNWATSNFVPARYPQSFNSAAPSTGTWERGDIIWNSAPSPSGAPGWVCTTSGTFGSLAGVTAATTAGSTSVSFSTATGLAVGMFITIAGVTGTKRILTLSGTSATVDVACDATVSAGAVAYVTAVFKAMANLAA